MDGLPPNPPHFECASQAPSPVSEEVLEKLKAALPNTSFESAWPACIPGWVAIRLKDGNMGYADKSGRYFILGIALDIEKKKFLDRQLDGRTQ
ncbi:hypothetical protein LC612_23190 [Nostoc sp. CHAB 5834]|nr:hypothetical protein [Nostoc sp. CHAB 5834]